MHNLTYKRMCLEDDTDIPELITIYQIPEIAQYISIGNNYFRYVTNSEEVYFYKVYENNKFKVFAISDGMGTGKQARDASKLALDLFKKF